MESFGQKVVKMHCFAANQLVLERSTEMLFFKALCRQTMW